MFSYQLKDLGHICPEAEKDLKFFSVFLQMFVHISQWCHFVKPHLVKCAEFCHRKIPRHTTRQEVVFQFILN